MTDEPFDPTKPVMTREGMPARVICTDCRDPYRPIVALIWQDGAEVPRTFTERGWVRLGSSDDGDLVNSIWAAEGHEFAPAPEIGRAPFIVTLRDRFAGQALAGLLANPRIDTTFDKAAAAALNAADAMLAERARERT